MLYVLRIGWENLKNRDRYPKEKIQAFALGVVLLKRFSVKEVVTSGGQKVVEDGFPKIIFEVAYLISQLEMMATLSRGQLKSP